MFFVQNGLFDDLDDGYDLIFDDEEEERRRGGSLPGKAPNIDRRAGEGYVRIVRDYFDVNPTYPDHIFARRFRMPRVLFNQIYSARLERIRISRRRATARVRLASLAYKK